MRSTPLNHGCWIALVLGALLVACDKNPTAPVTPPTNSPPTGTPQAILTRIDLTGPASVPPGETAQFTATGSFSDGSSRDVSSQASWRTSSPAVLSVSSTGLATAHDRGESSITASFNGRSATRGPVIVVPAGTYRLSGTVRDAGVAVTGAQVSVSVGPAQGLTTSTLNGSYRLYGVSGDSEIRVAKAGYVEQKARLQVTTNQTLDFELALSAPRDDVTGTWTLTVKAADECRTKLSADLMQRKYTAVLQQTGPRVTARLDGGTFYQSGNRTLNTFQGVMEPQQLAFQVIGGSYYYFYYYTPDVLEKLSDTAYYSFSGSAAITGSGSVRSGTLNGAIGTYGAPPRFSTVVSCTSNGHRFELTR